MRQLQTSTLTNQDISAFLLTATYTADADRAVMVSISADQVAGNGDYKAYITRQIAGAGSAYMVGPITTFTVPSGITAIAFTSVLIPVENTDVIKAYVSGLAGDTSTPDIITRFYELTYIRPTVNGRTLDIAATGEVGMDFTNRLDTTGILPSAAAGGAGGLPTVDASNYVAGVLALATDAVSAAALKADAVDEILDEVIEGSVTMRQALRIFLAALAGKSAGGGTATLTFQNIADDTARITATVDANGDRTAITLDGAHA